MSDRYTTVCSCEMALEQDFVFVKMPDSNLETPIGEYTDPSVNAMNDGVQIKPPLGEKTTVTQSKGSETPTLSAASTTDHGRVPMPTVLQYRSVVIVGAIGAGKKTVAKHLIGHDSQPTKFENSVRDNVRKLEMESDNFMYSINMISVPEGNIPDEEVRCAFNDEIRKLEGVNVVLFVIRRGQFADKDIVGFQRIIQNLRSGVASMSAMIVTGCEDLEPEKRNGFVADFQRNPATSEIANFMQKGIITVGFPDLSSQSTHGSTMTERIEMDRKELQELVRSCGELHVTKEILHHQEETRFQNWCSV